MQKKNNSEERKKYLRKNRITKVTIIVTQITILIAFVILWEVLANKGIIDSFITSQPSRMLKTFMNLSQNNLLEHLGVTCYETIVGFLSGTVLGIILVFIFICYLEIVNMVQSGFLGIILGHRKNNHKIILTECQRRK